MFLLDTNVISELRAGRSTVSLSVRHWASEIPAHQLYLSAVTVFELETGVLSMERKDIRQGRVLRQWLSGVLQQFSSQILPFGVTTAILCAQLHVPDRRQYRDAMIAATAKEHGYTVVTRNTDDFQSCGLRLLNPWLAAD